MRWPLMRRSVHERALAEAKAEYERDLAYSASLRSALERAYVLHRYEVQLYAAAFGELFYPAKSIYEWLDKKETK